MNLGAAEAIARAVLYEGYILYPYRPSVTKNRQRWTFGGIFPREFAARTGSDPCTMQAQCLVRGSAPVIDIKVRFLHAVERELGAMGLTQPVAAAVDPAVELVEQVIRQLLAEENPSWTPATHPTTTPGTISSLAESNPVAGE